MIEVQTRELRQALAIADRVCDRRSIIPVLQAVRASANGMFKLEASDLDMTAMVEIPCSGDEDEAGLCLPQFDRLRSALGQVGGQTTTLRFGEAQRASIASGQLAVEVKGLPGDDFPGVYRVDEERFSVDIGADVLAQLARLMPAISTVETRYYLNGVCVKALGGWRWQFAATDGHRLHMVDVPLPGATGVIRDGMIIPRRFLATVLALFQKSKEPVTLLFGMQLPRNSDGTLADGGGAERIEVRGMLNGARVALASKLIDGNYPDYGRVIPADNPFGLTVARRALVSAVQAVAGFGDGKVKAVRIVAKPEGVEVALSSALGVDAALFVPAQHDLPEGYAIGFNGNYLLATLAQLSGDEAHFRFGAMEEAKRDVLTNVWRPAVVRDPVDTALTCVLMPMRV